MSTEGRNLEIQIFCYIFPIIFSWRNGVHKVNIKGSETIIDNRFFQLGEKSQHGSSRWATQPHSHRAVFPIVQTSVLPNGSSFYDHGRIYDLMAQNGHILVSSLT